MKLGELDFAIRKALDNFDNWNDYTGVFYKGESYWYEIQSVVEDAVKIGAKIACEGVNADLSDIIDK